MLLHIDGVVVEIRPGELFQSKGEVDSRYLEQINKKVAPKRNPIVKSSKKPKIQEIFKEELNASSS